MCMSVSMDKWYHLFAFIGGCRKTNHEISFNVDSGLGQNILEHMVYKQFVLN